MMLHTLYLRKSPATGIAKVRGFCFSAGKAIMIDLVLPRIFAGSDK
jgi:hypothetical protein